MDYYIERELRRLRWALRLCGEQLCFDFCTCLEATALVLGLPRSVFWIQITTLVGRKSQICRHAYEGCILRLQYYPHMHYALMKTKCIG